MRVGCVGLDVLGAGSSSELSMASWGLRSSLGAEGSPGTGGGDGWGCRAGAEPAGEEKEALQFGLVFVESALAPGVEWPRLAPAPALGCHRRPRWRWTRRHLAALPGPGGAGGSAQAPHTARSSGWASAAPPGCLRGEGEAGEMGLKPERDCDGEDGPLVREAHAGWSTGTFSSNPQTCRAAVP